MLMMDIGRNAGSLVLAAVVSAVVSSATTRLVIAGQEGTAPLTDVRAQRVNVVDGQNRNGVVLAAAPKLPGVIRDGVETGSRKNLSGLILYNNKGDEVGGLIATIADGKDGSHDGGESLSLDHPGHDGQAISLMHWASGGFVRSALRINDYPADISGSEIASSPAVKDALKKIREAKTDEDQEKAAQDYVATLGRLRYYAERVYLGSEGDKKRRAMLELKDSLSRPRLRLVVDEHDEPRIEFLGTDGKVVKTIGSAAK